MKVVTFLLLAVAAFVLAAGNPVQAQSDIHTAYIVASGTVGDQDLSCCPQTLGMDFDVKQPIEIVSLGVFDSSGNGIAGNTAAHIFDRTTHAVIATLSFSASSPGQLVGGSRFKTLATPLSLAAGFKGSIVEDFLSAPMEPNGNKGNNRPNAPWTTDGAGGAVLFVGGGRIGRSGNPSTYPTELDGGPADRYAAGTFQYVVVPEPSLVALLGLAFTSVACLRSRRAF
jgi:hypothetical protein